MPRLRNLAIRVRGGDPLPGGVAFDLQRAERVLTWGRIAGGGIAAATDFGLRTTATDTTAPGFHRWHEINRATWTDGYLTIDEMSGASASYKLTEPRGVPVAVREHVDATVIVSEQYRSGDATFRIVARRDLSNGKLIWSTVFNGPDAAGDALRAQAEEVLESVRRRFGG